MSEVINEAELGRNKKNSSPPEHLSHLLNIGWPPSSLLIQKYVAKFGLQNDLAAWKKAGENSKVENTAKSNAAKR